MLHQNLILYFPTPQILVDNFELFMWAPANILGTDGEGRSHRLYLRRR
ncbi:MAG: hypothetical protein M3O20_05365 [Acidobacteriota bacterium]|nr:hypothetical protein [Acidobacteriota bacterium]